MVNNKWQQFFGKCRCYFIINPNLKPDSYQDPSYRLERDKVISTLKAIVADSETCDEDREALLQLELDLDTYMKAHRKHDCDEIETILEKSKRCGTRQSDGLEPPVKQLKKQLTHPAPGPSKDVNALNELAHVQPSSSKPEVIKRTRGHAAKPTHFRDPEGWDLPEHMEESTSYKDYLSRIGYGTRPRYKSFRDIGTGREEEGVPFPRDGTLPHVCVHGVKKIVSDTVNQRGIKFRILDNFFKCEIEVEHFVLMRVPGGRKAILDYIEEQVEDEKGNLVYRPIRKIFYGSLDELRRTLVKTWKQNHPDEIFDYVPEKDSSESGPECVAMEVEDLSGEEDDDGEEEDDQ